MQLITEKIKNKIGDGARTNLYRLDIVFPFPTPEIDETSHMLITSTKVPSVKTGTPISVKLPYGKIIKLASVQRVFDTFTATIINDEKMIYKKYFEKWITEIAPWNSNEGTLSVQHETQATLSLLAVDGKTVLRKYKLYYFFPESVGDVTLDGGGEDIQKFSLTAHYVGEEITEK